MTINGVSFDFNATKLENLKKIDECMPKMQKALHDGSTMFGNGHMYEGAKKQIEGVRQFFLDLVDVDVVGECDDLALAIAFIEDFKIQIEKQREKVSQEYFKRK